MSFTNGQWNHNFGMVRFVPNHKRFSSIFTDRYDGSVRFSLKVEPCLVMIVQLNSSHSVKQ